jgi:translocation and assembly module TamB
LTFNLLKRKFDIQKGSKLTFKGEPTDADVDITAVYTANTAPLDLVKDQLEGSAATIRNTYLQKLPFAVDLKMQGQLLKPVITFDILLPDDKNYNVSQNIVELVNEKLTEIRKEPSELNKQVFALLLLGRFVTENPFESSGPGATPESIARESVSKLLTEQLNQLASSLVKGVNLNFDVQSQDDYSTGNREQRTDLNVALSKKLLNDRLTVTVGSNFELEGAQNSGQQANNIAGDVALDYQLSKDGRYMLRAYRKNDYDGVLEGYVIETGVGFIITVDYNQFKEIFQNQKRKDRLKAEKKAKQQNNAAAKDDPKTSSK